MANYRKEYQPIKYDDYITPNRVWDEIAPHIPKNITISMPFYADGSCGDYMKGLGFDVIHKDEDFFKFDRGEAVIDNPPYDLKKKIIETLIERDKPFMLLVPVSTLSYEYVKHSSIIDDLQICIPYKRVNFIKYNKQLNKRDVSKRSHCPFEVIWLCNKMNLKNDITFL